MESGEARQHRGQRPFVAHQADRDFGKIVRQHPDGQAHDREPMSASGQCGRHRRTNQT